jgi:hypothetical protein
MSRRRHEEIVAALEDDALLALSMAFADRAPQGWDWSVRARELWAEVRD